MGDPPNVRIEEPLPNQLLSLPFCPSAPQPGADPLTRWSNATRTHTGSPTIQPSSSVLQSRAPKSKEAFWSLAKWALGLAPFIFYIKANIQQKLYKLIYLAFVKNEIVKILLFKVMFKFSHIKMSAKCS